MTDHAGYTEEQIRQFIEVHDDIREYLEKQMGLLNPMERGSYTLNSAWGNNVHFEVYRYGDTDYEDASLTDLLNATPERAAQFQKEKLAARERAIREQHERHEAEELRRAQEIVARHAAKGGTA